MLNCGMTLRNKVQDLQDRAAHVFTCSSYDVDAGQTSDVEKPSSLPAANSKSYDGYKSLHGLTLNYLSSKFKRRKFAYNVSDSENKTQCSITTHTTSAIVVPFSGTVFLVT